MKFSEIYIEAQKIPKPNQTKPEDSEKINKYDILRRIF